MSETPTLADDSFTDPAIAACHLALWTRKDGAMTNAVQLLVRPGDVRSDESGAHPGERFVMLMITREEVAAMLCKLKQDLADCLRAAGSPDAAPQAEPVQQAQGVPADFEQVALPGGSYGWRYAVAESAQLLRAIDKNGGLRSGGESYPNALCVHDMAQRLDALLLRSVTAAPQAEPRHERDPLTLDMVRALPTIKAPEIDGEESDGTPRYWRSRPYVSLTQLERLLLAHGIGTNGGRS